MRTFAITLALVGFHGIAAAQPGGADLPIAPPQPDPQPSAGDPMAAQPGDPMAAQPAGAPQQPMLPDPATAPTRATFVSTSEQQWDVWVDRQAICSTPCTLGLNGMSYVALRSQERRPIRLDVGYVPQGDVMVAASPLRNGLYAGGIVMTTFSGMALATGISLTAVGWGTGRDGMRTAGLITGVAGAVGLYTGINMMRRALPKLSIGPAQPYVGGNQVGFAGTF